MSLYFRDFVSTVSTLMVACAVIYIFYSGIKNRQIQHWGRRIALLAIFGLVICCFVAVRDGYDKSVQAYFDSEVTAGLFTLDSIQSTLCCIGGAVIAFSSISSIFIKNAKYRKVMFFTLSSVVTLKILIVEISRWMV